MKLRNYLEIWRLFIQAVSRLISQTFTESLFVDVVFKFYDPVTFKYMYIYEIKFAVAQSVCSPAGLFFFRRFLNLGETVTLPPPPPPPVVILKWTVFVSLR